MLWWFVCGLVVALQDVGGAVWPLDVGGLAEREGREMAVALLQRGHSTQEL